MMEYAHMSEVRGMVEERTDRDMLLVVDVAAVFCRVDCMSR